jgi:manganese oxidase
MLAAMMLAAGGCTPGRAHIASDANAVANDNRVAAGSLRGDVRTVTLVARLARWMPTADTTRGLEVEAFGEEGRPASVPAPLLRARAGTAIRLTVRNTLADTLAVCGFAGRYCEGRDSVRVAPGDSATIDLRGDAPGTYVYWATSLRPGRVRARGFGGQLIGAYVIDGANDDPARDRIFVMTGWSEGVPVAAGSDTPFVQGINGRMWPDTERLTHAVGDTVRWRVINASSVEHPMHLHGFYFRVDARGGPQRDTIHAPAQQRLAVTENLGRLETMSMTWVPERDGRWLFHCHRAFHMSAQQRQHLHGERNDTWGQMPATALHRDHARDGMAGLVMGITVTPRPESRRDMARRTADGGRTGERAMRLVVQQRSGRYGTRPGLGYVLQSADDAPRADSVAIPGPTLVLGRDVPVAITVVNRMHQPTAVHWHGIELESFFDGVAGWSGHSSSATPLIAPGDSFVVRFTPPRSGTFIYHSHVNEVNQLASGLYGALVVVDQPTRWDPRTDHVMLLGQDGPSNEGLVVLNGSAPPRPLEIRAGVLHRFRFINIIPQDLAELELRADSTTPLAWRMVAKDGADLPEAQRIESRARVKLAPGETYDFEMTPRPGAMQLVVRSFNNFTMAIRAR